LDYVVTIGVQSREYLAPAAREADCQVKSFTDPVRAGEFVRDVLQPGAIILAKGSQNGVFAEEAVKQLLRNPSDAGKLVRQSEEWMGKKRFN
jgi:UDP-N-acetylmuramyl pentapeptide synthase